MSDRHIPVLLTEILQHLDLQPGNIVIDGTVGHGGHAAEMLKLISPTGKLLGIDRDARNLEFSKKNLEKFGDSAILVEGSYADVADIATSKGIKSVDVILLDLGVSSAHYDDPSRGFSFRNDGPLDMRFDVSQEFTAETIVNEWEEEDLARIFRKWGEERYARQIAVEIIRVRKEKRLTSTAELASLIASVTPRRGRIHPATKAFQALRIEVNNELGELERGLPALADLLRPGGTLAVISFHSLEDRVVKRFIAGNKKLKQITKHVVVATDEEQKNNRRSRSAKLRIAIKA